MTDALTKRNIAITDHLSRHDTHFIRSLSPRLKGVWQEIHGRTRRIGSVAYSLGYWRPVAYGKKTPILWVGPKENTIRGAVMALVRGWAYYDAAGIPPGHSADEEKEEAPIEEPAPRRRSTRSTSRREEDDDPEDAPVLCTDEYFAQSCL